MKCDDKMSGETFEIAGKDIATEIEQWILDGIDSDSGPVAYDVDTENGENYRAFLFGMSNVGTQTMRKTK